MLLLRSPVWPDPLRLVHEDLDQHARPQPSSNAATSRSQSRHRWSEGGTSGSCSLPDEQEDSLDFEKIGGTSKQ